MPVNTGQMDSTEGRIDNLATDRMVDEGGRVEVSVVGSPEVFGAQQATTTTYISASPDSQDERQIERCDVSESPSDPRPPKKRYTISGESSSEPPQVESPSGAQLPRAAPPVSAFSDARQVPTGVQFQQSLSNWQWVNIDNTQLPAVLRGGERFLAVHMVQLKLLSKFPPAIPAEIITRFTMVSHKMNTVEAWQFNAINAVLRKFDLGCQLFTTNDEVVRLNDVQMFYWNVKALNLSRIIQQYDAELQNANGNLTFIATITAMRKHVENDLEVVRSELHRLDEPLQLAQTVHSLTSSHSAPPNGILQDDQHVTHNHVSNGTATSSILSDAQTDINIYL